MASLYLEKGKIMAYEHKGDQKGKCGISDAQAKQMGRSIRHLGFSKYKEYLESPEWQALREKVLERDSYLCVCCRLDRATQVHHSDCRLETLTGKNLGSLHSVCDDCHETYCHPNNVASVPPVP